MDRLYTNGFFLMSIKPAIFFSTLDDKIKVEQEDCYKKKLFISFNIYQLKTSIYSNEEKYEKLELGWLN